MFNTTLNTAVNATYEQYSGLILQSLTKELQVFSPNFFGIANLPKPEHTLPLRDLSSSISNGASRGDVISVQLEGDAVAKDKIPNVPVTQQTIEMNKVQLQLNRHKYVSVLKEDPVKMLTSYSSMQRLAAVEGRAIAEAFERDVMSLSTGFSTVVGTGAGDILTDDDLSEVARLFYENGVDIIKKKAIGIVTPIVYQELIKSRNEYQLAGMKGLEGYNSGRFIETPYNINIVQSNYIPIVAGAAKMMVLTEEAIMIGFGIRPRIQTNYEVTELGEIQIADVLYGVAEMRDVAGILLDFDEVNA